MPSVKNKINSFFKNYAVIQRITCPVMKIILKRIELSLNSGYLDWKVRKIGVFQFFVLLREIVLRLISKHFPHIP